jgi:hypothetical protein
MAVLFQSCAASPVKVESAATLQRISFHRRSLAVPFQLPVTSNDRRGLKAKALTVLNVAAVPSALTFHSVMVRSQIHD